MKKFAILLICILIAFNISGCGKKKKADPVLAEGDFIKISSKQVGDISDKEKYTVSVLVNQNGDVKIFLEDVEVWYSEEAIPEYTTKLSSEQVETIKGVINEVDFYNMRENVGSRENLDGEYRKITVYTTDKEYVTYGLNSSNRAFKKLYETIYDMLRLDIFSYVEKITTAQASGERGYMLRGLMLNDESGENVLASTDIEKVYKVSLKEHPELGSQGEGDGSKLIEYYIIAIRLTKEGAEKLNKTRESKNVQEEYKYFLYMDNEYLSTIILDHDVDKEIYIDSKYLSGEADDLCKKINDRMTSK